MIEVVIKPDKEQMTYEECVRNIEILMGYKSNIDDQIYKLREKCQLLSLSNSQYVVKPPMSGGVTYGRKERTATEV